MTRRQACPPRLCRMFIPPSHQTQHVDKTCATVDVWRAVGNPPRPTRSPSGQRLHQDHNSPHARAEDGDEGESRRQINSDLRPVSTGRLGSHRPMLEWHTALEDSVAQLLPLVAEQLRAHLFPAMGVQQTPS